jgi:AcrR family transcriptional regulator
MPRPFTQAERTRVQQRLVSVAREHFTRFGYRRGNIGEIAREAGIAKGSVYLFFASKVELFVAAATQVEEEMRHRIRGEVGGRPAVLRDHLLRLFRLQGEVFAEHPLLRVLTDPAEAGALFRDLPPEAAAEMQTGDERFFAALVAGWGPGPGAYVDPALLVAACRALYALGLQRELIGADGFAALEQLVMAGMAHELDRRAASAAARG